MSTEPKRMLRLTVEVPDLWADDLDEAAAVWADDREPTDDDRLDVVLEEWVYADAGLTLVFLPGDKCGGDEFVVKGFNARIVGATTVERKRRNRGETP